MNRSRLIRDSIETPRMALLGWIPILGVPFWFLAFRFLSGPGLRREDTWNPARTRCIWASILLFPGLLIQLATGLALGFQQIRDNFGPVPGFIGNILEMLLA